MQCSYTVYRVAAYDRQICHSDLTISDDRHISDLIRIIAVFFCQFDHETTVDLFHDLIDTGQQTAEQFHGPFFQGFCQDGMVCIRTYLSCDIPRLFPGNVVFIHQNTHQFCNCHAGVCIIQLECNLFRQQIEICMHLFETFDHSLDRCGYEEILLTQTQLLAFRMFIRRIQHVCQSICQYLFFLRLLEQTIIEVFQIQLCFGNCFPQTQRIYCIVAIADHRIVIGHSHNGFIVFMDHFIAAFIISHCTHVAAEFYFYCILGTFQAPCIAVFQPVIRIFLLLAIFIDALFKNTIAIADTAAISRQGKRRQGFQEASCQTAQTAVAQTGIGLCIFHAVVINPQFRKGFFYFIKHFQIDEGIAEEAAHQEFHGQVVNHLYIFFVIFIMGLHPFFCNYIPDSEHSSLIHFFCGCVFQCFTIQGLYIFPDHFFQCIFFDQIHNNPLGYQR